MNEFIEKLIGRLEEAGQYHLELSEENKIDVRESHRHKSFAGVYGNAISIIKELAEEHKGGWIPCSERLPEIGTCVIVAIGTGYVCDEVLIYDYTHSNAKEPCFHKWDDEMWKCYTPKVIAWQPLPEPYQQKE